MAKEINGFLTKADFIDNNEEVISDFFELSPIGLTYSKSWGEYQAPNYPGDILYTFLSKNYDTGDRFLLLPAQLEIILSVCNGVFSYMQTNSYPYNVTELLQSVQSAHADVVSNLKVGDLIPGAQYTFPEWVQWNDPSEEDYFIKIWFRDLAFCNQYVHYDIVVVPPFEDLELFFGPFPALQATLKDLTVTDTVNALQTARGDHPDTVSRVYTFEHHNVKNPVQTVDAPWGALVYGRNGDALDSIKEAIVEYIKNHSKRPITDWEVSCPELFRRTEFMIYPRWDQIAIPNITTLSALYGSVFSPVEMMEFAHTVWTELPGNFIDQNVNTIPFDYKCITALIINGTTNEPSKSRFKELFPDYIPVNTASLDFNRMEIKTREWVLAIVEALRIAETATEYSSVLNPYRRVIRDNILYIAREMNKINYLVATRSNIIKN